ncbi:MAG: hypothetical protein PHR16_05400 [Methylovulum sp.]|nr:hypothetical protein [Methylovulum sp.]
MRPTPLTNGKAAGSHIVTHGFGNVFCRGKPFLFNHSPKHQRPLFERIFAHHMMA